MLNEYQKSLLNVVISAAAKGNYCHGNGADWVITDDSGSNVLYINHVRESIDALDADASAKYLASTPRHESPSTVESLRAFIA
jgi:hypothetical protein